MPCKHSAALQSLEWLQIWICVDSVPSKAGSLGMDAAVREGQSPGVTQHLEGPTCIYSDSFELKKQKLSPGCVQLGPFLSPQGCSEGLSLPGGLGGKRVTLVGSQLPVSQGDHSIGGIGLLLTLDLLSCCFFKC